MEVSERSFRIIVHSVPRHLAAKFSREKLKKKKLRKDTE